MSDKNFYITTPIYYVNDVPHIGHAYTTIACDVVSRYKRLKGYDVHFLTGTDEHGQKIQQSAEKQGITPQALVDKIHLNFKELWRVLNISNDDFIRTTDERHIKTVQAVFKKLMDQGDIYKGNYEGYYCVPCETYVPESSIIIKNGGKTCPDCGRPLTIMTEESYFFKCSKYVDELIKYYENNLNGVMPRIRYNEIMSFLKSGVRDQSVSRTTLKWGIPVPGDEKHVVYVWFDALINYISALNYGSENLDLFNKFWPSAYHMVGKDIIRFHCVTWPLMLLALGIDLPKSIIAHGWWTFNGEKMSKSKGNVIDPFKMVEEYGLDPFRYFLMREVPFGNDGDFSEPALVGRINSDLANDLGNLLNRTLQMIESYRGGVVPAGAVSGELKDFALKTLEAVDLNLNKFAFDEALKNIWAFISRANKFIDETEPWKLAKDINQAEKLNCVLLSLYESLRFIALLIAPYMPDTSNKMLAQLGVKELGNYNAFNFGDGAGVKVNKAEILFPRIDLKEWQKNFEAKKEAMRKKMENLNLENKDIKDVEVKAEVKAAEAGETENIIEHEPEIEIDSFKAVEMRVAKIIKAEEIKKSKKLYKLEVDLGYETRTVCSGIKAFFSTEELVGKRVILVCNLKPAKLCGIESNGMILAASVKKDGVSEALTLVVPESDIPLGSRVS
ncbi:MAG: methionine--tRNA ligase [Synergistaceae bacterium]|nr:methionine--tRNA ligase [Synergistaceae bacterium]